MSAVDKGLDPQRRPYHLEATPLRDATDYLERYRQQWEERFVALDNVLEDLKRSKTKRKRTP